MAVIDRDDDREPAEVSATEPSPAPADADGKTEELEAVEQAPEALPAETAADSDAGEGSPSDGSGAGNDEAARDGAMTANVDATAPTEDAAPTKDATATGDETPTKDASATGDETPTKDETATEDEAATEGEADGKRPARPKMSRTRQMRLASLFRAFRSGRPMEGNVEAAIKGGYEVKLGKVRSFCPHSQIDLQRADEPAEHVGKQYLFRITQLRRGGDDIVVSRRAVLEDERKEEAKAVRATLIEGAIMQGRVAGIAEFGAFVDLGAGVMGLVHVSELSHTRVTRVSEAVKVGDPLSVKILKLDEKSKRVSLSARQAQADPWDGVAEQFKVGGVYPGEVRRVTDFGAFVELAPGVEALAPASEFPPSATGWREVLSAGLTRDWLVLSVDAGQHRISVTPPVEGAGLEDLPRLEAGIVAEGRVQRVEKFGVFVWMGPGRVGLMPSVWTGTQRGDDLSRRFPIGSPVQVDVVEVSEGGKRIRLAKRGVKIERDAPGGPPPRRPSSGRTKGQAGRAVSQNVGQDQAGGAFGTILADKLRAALGRPDDDS